MAFYRRIGKHPIRIEREVAGFVANRLQAAVNREVISLIAAGIASPSDIDAAFRLALGPRWAVIGPCLTRSVIRQAPVGDLVDCLPDEINAVGLASDDVTWDYGWRERFVSGISEMAAGRSRAELVAERDASLDRVLGLLDDR
jgi:hypothetical protein